MIRSIAVVGASLAGLSAVRALRNQSYDGTIIAIGAERHQPYDRPPLSKAFLTGACSEADLALSFPDEDLNVDWRLGTAAVRLDPGRRSLTLTGGAEVRVDAVILATGATARRLPGTDELQGVHTLRTLDDAVALRADLAAAERLVVVGAGFIGAEVASSARSLGLDVTVVEALPTPLAGPLGAELGAVCAGLHADHGVRLLTGVGVARITGSQKVEAVELTDGTRLPADVVVVGIGAQPNVAWLAGSGLDLAGGVVTDAAGATNVPSVFAVGDCAASFSPYARATVRSEHWTHALEQPVAAVATLLGDRREHAATPYFWSDQYGVRLQFAGHRTDGDTVRIVDGDPDRRSFLAVYERDGRPVAVLGMNQPKLFTPVAAPVERTRPRHGVHLMTPGARIMQPVCPLSAIPKGEAYRWEVNPPIAIFHTEDGEVFAIDDTCTHQDASLADGWLEGCEVECPLHASRFDLRTGQVDAPPAKKPVRTHQVTVTDDGMVHVDISDAAPNLPPGV